MDRLSDDNMCPSQGRVVAMMLSRLSVAPVMSKVLRSVDLATRLAIILLFPRTISDSLTPDMFNCRSFGCVRRYVVVEMVHILPFAV